MRDAISGISRSGNPTIVRVSLADSTRTVVTRIYSAVTDSVSLYNIGRVNLNLFLACIRVHNVWVILKWTLRDKDIPHVH